MVYTLRVKVDNTWPIKWVINKTINIVTLVRRKSKMVMGSNRVNTFNNPVTFASLKKKLLVHIGHQQGPSIMMTLSLVLKLNSVLRKFNPIHLQPTYYLEQTLQLLTIHILNDMIRGYVLLLQLMMSMNEDDEVFSISLNTPFEFS